MRTHIKGYRFFKGAISLFLLYVFILPDIGKASDYSYRDELLRKASAERLYNERYWKILLHYKPAGKGLVSLVDDPRFFLATTGKGDPKTELEATIAGFFEEDKSDQEHPICRFPARYNWIKERLVIDESRLPPVSCAKLEEALNAVNPKSVALVFPSAHISGPASMFGHTMLRVDSSDQSELISHAITYAATANDTNGLVFAFKGIFGYYNGNYSILPYYEKVKEYNDMEHRDIWEYLLNLTEDETRSLVLHIWELKDINSDYYFFDENCSYNILFLIEAARPSVRLTDKSGLKFWVIPADTIRDVEKSGLIERVKYRPSIGTRIRSIASTLGKDHQYMALRIVRGEIPPDKVGVIHQMSEDEKILTLELAAEFIQYRYSRREIDKDTYQRLFISSLKARSQLGTPVNDLYTIPIPLSPENGHSSSRLRVGLGYHKDSSFTEINWRGAYHDLLDPDEGYVEGYQINFFEASMRYYYEDNKLQLKNLYLLDILSVSPRDLFLKPISWKVKTGFTQKINKDGEEHIIYQLNPGGGFAYKLESIGLFYGLLETDLNVGGAYRDNYVLGAGPQIGIIRKITDSWKCNLTAETVYYELGDSFQENKASIVQTFSLNQNNSFNVSVSWEKVADHELSEVALNWNYYF